LRRLVSKASLQDLFFKAVERNWTVAIYRSYAFASTCLNNNTIRFATFNKHIKIAGAYPAGAIAPPKIYESSYIHHSFVQFGKQHSRFKAILLSGGGTCSSFGMLKGYMEREKLETPGLAVELGSF